MNAIHRTPVILMADDDADDRLLANDALLDCAFEGLVRFVEDGEELVNYLRRSGKYSAVESNPRPGLILLDLNMPRKNGKEVLREIKADPLLREIPVIVLTTSSSPDDISRCYQHGANAYVTKPGSYAALLDMVRNFSAFWLQTARLPETKAASPH